MSECTSSKISAAVPEDDFEHQSGQASFCLNESIDNQIQEQINDEDEDDEIFGKCMVLENELE